MGNWHPYHRLTFYVLFGIFGSIPLVKLFAMLWLWVSGMPLDIFTSFGYQFLWMAIVREWVETRPPKH